MTAQEKIADLEARVLELQEKLNSQAGKLVVPAVPLPSDHTGYIPRRVEVSLGRREHRLKLRALTNYLQKAGATLPHVKFRGGVMHVDAMPHALCWLLEQTQLTGEHNQC
jgi:hypothetical protein